MTNLNTTGSVTGIKLGFFELPLCRLHVLEAGEGPALIIVPATISECKDWIELVRFMAQWFHVFFFELPGHGESTPFQQPFTTSLVAETVEQLVDQLGIQDFSLMGFSFGGILAINTFLRLSDRIQNVILVSPCLSHKAVMLSRSRIRSVFFINHILALPGIQTLFLALLHNPHTVSLVFALLRRLGRIESSIELRPKFLSIRKSTLDVLNGQIKEILSVEFHNPPTRFATPCYLAMSINDPVLDFNTTLTAARLLFSDLMVIKLTHPYHQSPVPLTLDGLNHDYYDTVNEFLANQNQSRE
jgi:pimeloyl-ACP methyl ester carboxylesterase